MKLSHLILFVSTAVAAAFPASASEYDDAVECSAFYGVMLIKTPIDSPDLAKISDYSDKWKAHAGKITPSGRDVATDRDGVSNAMFDKLMNMGRDESQPFIQSLATRCRTLPDPSKVVYEDKVCMAFANHTVESSQSTISFNDMKAIEMHSKDKPTEMKTAQDRARAARKMKARSEAIQSAYRRKTKGSTYVKAESMNLYGDEAEAVISSCEGSLGVKSLN